MKNYFCLCCCVFVIAVGAKAQQIPNAGFESWSSQTIYQPVEYLTSNIFGSTGISCVSRVTDAFHGTYAAKLETVASGNDTVQGLILIGTPGNQTIDGGLPFSETPDSISFYIKHNIQPNDTGFFIVAFKQNGVFISQVVNIFVGSQPLYTRYCLATNLSAINPPDSFVVFISSSKMDAPYMPGSTLTIDSISFLNSVQEFPNGDFEDWNEINTNEDPDGWGSYAGQFPFYNLPVQVTKTAESYSGNYAVRLTSDTATVPPPFGTGVPGDTLLGILQLNLISGFSSTPFPFAYRPDSLVGYVKGTVASAIDNFNTIWIQLTNNTNVVGQIAFTMPNSISDYVRFSTPVFYTLPDVPDSMIFYIFAGNPGNPFPGNIFYVDDLEFIYNPVFVGSSATPKVYAYPNPATDNLSISTGGEVIESIVIYNSSGKVSAEVMPMNSTAVIDISELPAGIYLYKVNGAATGRFIKK